MNNASVNRENRNDNFRVKKSISLKILFCLIVLEISLFLALLKNRLKLSIHPFVAILNLSCSDAIVYRK